MQELSSFLVGADRLLLCYTSATSVPQQISCRSAFRLDFSVALLLFPSEHFTYLLKKA